MKDELAARKSAKGIATIRIRAGATSIVKDVALLPQPKTEETATQRALKRRKPKENF